MRVPDGLGVQVGPLAGGSGGDVGAGNVATLVAAAGVAVGGADVGGASGARVPHEITSSESKRPAAIASRQRREVRSRVNPGTGLLRRVQVEGRPSRWTYSTTKRRGVELSLTKAIDAPIILLTFGAR